jgi:hypothetical protein
MPSIAGPQGDSRSPNITAGDEVGSVVSLDTSVEAVGEDSSGAVSPPRFEQPMVTKTRAEARDKDVKRFTHLFWLV